MLSAHGSEAEQVGIQTRKELNPQLTDVSEFTEIPQFYCNFKYKYKYKYKIYSQNN